MEFLTLVDAKVHDLILQFRTPEFIPMFKGITYLANWQVVIPLMVLVSIILYKKQKTYILPLWSTVIFAEVVTFFLKIIIERPRPLGGVILEQDYSFPSGHATIAVAFYGFMALIVLSLSISKSSKQAIILVTLLLILCIGFSRLYLGVHYLSDVLAGYCVGAIGIYLGRYLFIHKKFSNYKFFNATS